MKKPRKRTTKRPIAVDLFCGAGGMSLGFEQAGFDVLLGVEMDGYHVATHERNFPYGRTICKSVSELTADEVFAAVGSDDVDLVCGGPPCQGFSAMGHRDAKDPRNTLVGQFVRIVEEVHPKAFVMENVPGMLAGAARPVLDDAIARLRKAGYRIANPPRILDASDFGVPQRRKRLILIGIREDAGSAPTYPTPHSNVPPTVMEAIGDLPDVDANQELFKRNHSNYESAPISRYARVMRGVEKDPTDFSLLRDWDGVCTGCLRVQHTPGAIELYRKTPPGEMVPGHKLPRLHPDKLAPTLRAGSDSARGSYTAPRPIHPSRPRCITAREAARLHGFPDWFAFYPLKWHAYRQVGNAVCPAVARALGDSVMSALGIAPFRPPKSLTLSNEFHLPAHRPRTLKRIAQVVHYPPVIERLFEKRFDENSERLMNGRFTFAEVQQAVRDTGVKLTWIRPDTFLAEIARSRNVLKLLEPCLSRGYTIRKVDDAEAIGEFVRAPHPQGLEAKRVERLNAPPRKSSGEMNGQETLFP